LHVAAFLTALVARAMQKLRTETAETSDSDALRRRCAKCSRDGPIVMWRSPEETTS
jgi:hypothetical protein